MIFAIFTVLPSAIICACFQQNPSLLENVSHEFLHGSPFSVSALHFVISQHNLNDLVIKKNMFQFWIVLKIYTQLQCRNSLEYKYDFDDRSSKFFGTVCYWGLFCLCLCQCRGKEKKRRRAKAWYRKYPIREYE